MATQYQALWFHPWAQKLVLESNLELGKVLELGMGLNLALRMDLEMETGLALGMDLELETGLEVATGTYVPRLTVGDHLIDISN